jgi:excisionase family DNA binding protein
MTEEPERLLTPDDLAELLRVARAFIIKQSHTGKIPGIKIGKAWRFRRSTIDRWLAEIESSSGLSTIKTGRSKN